MWVHAYPSTPTVITLSVSPQPVFPPHRLPSVPAPRRGRVSIPLSAEKSLVYLLVFWDKIYELCSLRSDAATAAEHQHAQGGVETKFLRVPDGYLMGLCIMLREGVVTVLSFLGLLVAYCHRFDIQVQSSRVYFVACTIGTSNAGSRPQSLPELLPLKASIDLRSHSLGVLFFSFFYY